MEYAQSEVTKMFNILQTREFYNKIFKKAWEDEGLIFYEDDKISEETFNRLKKRYSSRPPFVFFFNPTIQLEKITQYGFDYYVGYEIKRDDGRLVSIDFES